MKITMDRMRIGGCGRIVSLELEGAIRRRLLDFGLIEGTPVQCIRRSPTGSPVIYLARGTMLALRTCDSRGITVEVAAQ